MGLMNALLDAFLGPDRAVKRLVDPVFGNIWLNTVGNWRAKVVFTPLGVELEVHLFDAKENGPNDWQRNCFQQLTRQFSELRKAMEAPLWQEYESIRKDWQLESRAVPSPEEIWDVAKLVSVEICGDPSKAGVDFSLGHRIDWENDDHDLNVFFKNWQVLEVAMEG